MINEEIIQLSRDTETDLFDLGRAIQKEALAPGEYSDLLIQCYKNVKEDLQTLIEAAEREGMDYGE